MHYVPFCQIVIADHVLQSAVAISVVMKYPGSSTATSSAFAFPCCFQLHQLFIF
jgi:hypothetical protein